MLQRSTCHVRRFVSHRGLAAALLLWPLTSGSLFSKPKDAPKPVPWSFQPLRTSPLPSVKEPSWPRKRLDNYTLAKMEQAGVSPAPQADARTLLRRLSFDLTGLPPSPEEVAEYLQELKGSASARDVWERRVNRLLESPRFGERWGRHWLDVARYAESNGRESNLTFPHA